MLRYPLLWFIRGWRRFISPLYGDVCKFHPTCSAYGERAVEVHGGIKGGFLAARRIVSCHPWSMGGVDYVPGTPEARQWAEEEANEKTRASSGQKVS